MANETPEARFERWRTRGDGAALADVFDALAPGLLRLAIHLVGDPAAAEDLVQQTFVTAMERAASWDPRRPLEPWLQGILANHARDLRKSARRKHDPEFDLAAVLAREEDAPLESASRRELSGELARAVDALEEPYRTAVLLRLRHGMEAADIAHVLGRSPGAVRVLLHRAREMLRKSLPASIASALLLLAEPARGLECARNQTLEHAARLAPAASVGGGLLGGVIVMKKLVIAAAIVLAVATAWWWTRASTESVARDARDEHVASAIDDAASDADERSEPLAPHVDGERAPVEGLVTNTASELAPFPVRVVDGDTGRPVVGARLAFFAPKRGTWSDLRARWPENFRVDTGGGEWLHDWPWFRTKPTSRQRLDLDPIVSYEAPLPSDEPMVTATSDAKGNAVVELGPDRAFVVAEHPDYATRRMPPELERTVKWKDGKSSGTETFRDDVLLVTLFRARTLRGQLVDVEGRPLAERIALRVEGVANRDRLANGMELRRDVASETVWTNLDGSFEVSIGATRVGLRSLDARWFVANNGVHPERREPWAFVNSYVPGKGDTAWVPMQRNPVVRVLSAVDDTPVRDYRMLVQDIGERWPRGLVTRVRSADGRARLLDRDDFQTWSRPLGALRIHVMADGFDPGTVEFSEPKKQDEIVLRLRSGAGPVVSGTVFDDGRPIADASVMFATLDGGSWGCEDRERASFASTTDALGGFAVPVYPGAWVVIVEHESRTQCRAVEVPSATPLVFELARDTVVEFVVDAPAGTSFEGISAALMSGPGLQRVLELDEQGRARFGSLPAGHYTAALWSEREFRAAPGDAEFDLVADTTRTLHFVRETSTGPRNPRLVVDGLETLVGWTARSWSAGGSTVAVEADGRVPLDVGRRESRVRVDAPDGSTHLFRVPGEEVAEPVLRVARGRSELRGRLMRADGRPQTGRKIQVWPPDDEHGLECVESPVDQDGRFRIDTLPPGKQTLTIANAIGQECYDGLHFVQFGCRVAAGANEREIAIELPAGLDPAGSGRIALRGNVRDGAEPAAGLSLWIIVPFETPDGTLQIATTTTVLSDGTYSLPTLPAARHYASSPLPGGRSWSHEFTLPLDVAEARYDFALR